MNESRIAGAVLPLFSLRTNHDWGIGQITDLPRCAAWLRSAGHRLLQILPPHELSAGETSPYGALTAFGLDPIYAGLEAIPDLDDAAAMAAIGEKGATELARVRSISRVDYRAVRALKQRALAAAFARFRQREWMRQTPRAKSLSAFIEKESAWLEDLALYTVLREDHAAYGWETWPEDERERAPRALELTRERAADRLLEVAYVQWVLLEQWAHAREEMRALGVELMGDLPFVVCGESADVWSRASQFQRHMSLGAPPDGFAPDGQDWGLPPYNWLAMEADDLAWVRARTRHAARLYDRFRLDHVVGFFRQWVKGKGGGRGRFDPEGTDAQRARGRRVLGAIVEEANGSKVIAEDLGVIPPFVRETLGELGLPGYRVIPWEKDEHQRFRNPAHFPAASVATWSTHDTQPVTAWWSDFSADERGELSRAASFDESISEDGRSLALLRMLFQSGSDTTLVLAQELIGEEARINLPGTVTDDNWTYRLPAPIESLERDARIAHRFEEIRRDVTASGR
jgi:4-alpha-glucanotransferase